MKRFVAMAIIAVCGKAILLASLIVIAIALFGRMNHWNGSLDYSNAFFIVGCVVIGVGGLSRLTAGQERNAFQLFHAASFREMSASEQANFIVMASSPASMVLLSLFVGISLILVSVLVSKMF